MSVPTSVAAAPTQVATIPTPLSPLPKGWTSLARAFVIAARAHASREAMADSSKASLTYGDAFMRAVILSRVLARRIGSEPYVGLLIPPSVPTAVANLALQLIGKIPVNLNYTAGQALVDSSISQCGIKSVITAQTALDRYGITPSGELILLEDLPKQVTPLDKAIGAFIAKFVPISLLGRFLPGLRNESLDQTATVIFTSGSTGDPKGVVLSNRNILSNVHQVNTHLKLAETEVVLGILPMFHSFGFTVEIWIVLALGKKVVFHVSPLDARIIGDLCEKHGVTMIAGTPTFMRTYLKKCPKEQFSKLTTLLLGAEKVKIEFSKEIKATLGIDALEGYGTTELSPVVAVNVNHDLVRPDGRTIPGYRLGTVGIPVPGTSIKTVDPETGLDLPVGTVGVINVKGPQVMVGYLNRPEKTAEVLKDGWYSTGDLGFVDEDGFLRITDRLSRFSKIAGEMVPHLGVESAILEALKTTDPCVAVTSLPDVKRGERLIVLYTPEMTIRPEELQKRLQETNLPKLWIPAADDFIAVDEIPILGTGKIDLRGLKEVAAARRGTAS